MHLLSDRLIAILLLFTGLPAIWPPWISTLSTPGKIFIPKTVLLGLARVNLKLSNLISTLDEEMVIAAPEVPEKVKFCVTQ